MPIDLDRVRALCFDIDGTLSDTDDLWVAGFERRVRFLRRLLPRRDSHAFARWVVMTLESPGNLVYHTLDRFNLDAPVGRLYNLISRWNLGRKPRHFWLIPQVDELLARLVTRFPLAVVSARDRRNTLAFLDQFGLQPHFRAIATAMTCRHTKPFPDPILWAAEQMGVDPAECLMIGDTTVDIRAGKAAGAQTVGVLCGFGTEAELRRAGADLILPSTAALGNMLAPE